MPRKQLPTLLVCGSREFSEPKAVRDKIWWYFRETPRHRVIHGAARGIDSLAAKLAKEHGHDVVAFPADWEKYGKRAGYVRNIQMLDEQPDFVVAFWNGISTGTAHTIREAKKRGIKTLVINI